MLTGKGRTEELWLTNEPGIAAASGPVILAIEVPESATLDAYPQRTGNVEEMNDIFSEPAEFLMLYNTELSAKLYGGKVYGTEVIAEGRGKNRDKLEFQLKIDAMPISAPESLVRPMAKQILDAYDDGPLCGMDFDDLMSQLYYKNDDVIRSMGYEYKY